MYRVWVKDKEGADPDHTGYVVGEPDPTTHDQEIAEFEHLKDAEAFRQSMAKKHPGAVYVIHELRLWAFPFKSQDTDEGFPEGDIHHLGYGVVLEFHAGDGVYKSMCPFLDTFKTSTEGSYVDWAKVRGVTPSEFVVFGGKTAVQIYAAYLEKNYSHDGRHYYVCRVELSVREINKEELEFKENEYDPHL